MAFLSEFTPEQLKDYEDQLKNGVFIIPNPLGDFKEWYVLERNQQILFQKIQKLAQDFPCAVFFEEPSVTGYEGGWKEWTTLSTNQRKLSVALDYLIKSVKPPPCSVIFHTSHVSNESTPMVGCGNEFPLERLDYYEERLKKGVFIIPKPLGNWQEWYILERNQQILFHKIQKLADVFQVVIDVKEPSNPGSEGGWKEWTTLSTNQRKLSAALDRLPAVFN